MAAVPGALQGPDLREQRSGRWLRNQIATALMVLALIVIAIPLILVIYTVIAKGASVINWSFLTSDIPNSIAPPGTGGMWPAILGTLEITGFATLMAVPLGVLGAVYLNEYGGNRTLARVIRFMADVMTGVPSIVMGLFIFTIWVIHFGFSGFAGSLGLACLMLPVVIRSSEEMLRLVPNHLREASYALGATKARVTVTVVIPAAISGIVSGALLAVARAAGETAPLLFAILITQTPNSDLFNGANTALPAQIFVNASSPFQGAQGRAWGAALTLIAIAFVLMISARVVTARFTRHSR